LKKKDTNRETQKELHKYAKKERERTGGVTPVAGSIFRPLSQTHIFKREFKNGHISRFCCAFQEIEVISSGQFCSAEEVDLSFNLETKQRPQISKSSFLKRDRENVFLQMFRFGEK